MKEGKEGKERKEGKEGKTCDSCINQYKYHTLSKEIAFYQTVSEIKIN